MILQQDPHYNQLMSHHLFINILLGLWHLEEVTIEANYIYNTVSNFVK